MHASSILALPMGQSTVHAKLCAPLALALAVEAWGSTVQVLRVLAEHPVSQWAGLAGASALRILRHPSLWRGRRMLRFNGSCLRHGSFCAPWLRCFCLGSFCVHWNLGLGCFCMHGSLCLGSFCLGCLCLHGGYSLGHWRFCGLGSFCIGGICAHGGL